MRRPAGYEPEPVDELSEMALAAQVLARAVVEEVRELAPSPAQWARARALVEVREWVSTLVKGGMLDYREADMEIERLTMAWATLIESGAES